MKIAFSSVNGETLKEWELNPSQERFWKSDKKFVLFSGGYGCLAGDTKILNADTLQEEQIQQIHCPIKVFSHNGTKAQALTPVKYEKASLFEVKTNLYQFTGTKDHQVLTVSGWKTVSELAVGELLLVSSPDLPYSTSESFLSVLFSNVLHWIRTVQGFLGGYRPVLSFYDGQPRLAKGIALEMPPQPDDVPVHSLVGSRMDGHSSSKEHNPPYLVSSHPSKSDSFPSEKHPLVSSVEDYSEGLVSEHIFERARSMLRFLLSFVSHWLVELAGYSSSHPYPTMTVDEVQSISYIGVDNYYDLHVLGTNSYYAQGFFHHNCGKSLMLTLKAINQCLLYPNNYILMGRKTYPELRDTLLKEFFNVCPDEMIKDYLKAEGRVIFYNRSEIIFRHLDTIAESEIRSLNLGGAYIDQAEDVSKGVFDGLRGRLRREGIPDHEKKIYLSCNPALTWLFAEFKQNTQPEYEVIEASTLENEKNLPAGYVADLLKYPENYKRQFVYGVWDENLLSDRAVFAREYLEKLSLGVKEPIRTREGLSIYAEFIEGHEYQMGIDASEGNVIEGEPEHKQTSDESAITITDLTLEEEVASWSGRIPPDVVAEKAITFAHFYATKKFKITIVPEMNSIGLALLNRLNREPSDYIRIYRREEFDKKTGQRSEKEGWRTTRQSKPLLVSHFQERLRLGEPKVRSRRTYEQFKTFVFTTESRKNGMGAEGSFHDDRLIALLLSFWRKGPYVPGKVIGKKKDDSGIIIRNGKLFIPSLAIENQTSSWKSN